jgi:DNA-binding MarR family transcriptional regulator
VTVALKPTGLTHVQFVLLACTWWLSRDTVGARQAQVAAQAGTDAVMTSEVLRRLEAKGLLTRDPDPSDARARLVRTTARGAALASSAIALVEGVDAAFFPTVSQRFIAELRVLADLPPQP